MIVFAKHHPGSQEPIRARSAAGYLAPVALVASLSGACTDARMPLTPDDAGARVVASQSSMDRSSVGEDADDVIDALDRISPAFGASPSANQVRGVLNQLLQDALQNDVPATRRDADVLSQALDRLASLGDPGLGAEIDAVRFVADARK